MYRTRQLMLGNVEVGGGAPVTVQSMTNTDTRDPQATLAQIEELSRHGCDIIRVAVPDRRAADAFREIAVGSPIPVVADIHFDYRLALAAIDAGARGLRINPGNIGGGEKIRRVAESATAASVPIRIGVNGGSLEADIHERYGGATAEALVESAVRNCELMEDLGCTALKVSLKASSVPVSVRAYRAFASRMNYPVHVGITEAGSFLNGTVKSAVGIGALLLDGIGDTIRVSLTAPPLQEVRVGIKILEAAGLRQARPEIVSCPTCGRTEIDLFAIVETVEREVEKLKARGYTIALSKIAIMGCVVNGPGEARDSDLGIAGGKGKGVLFKQGEIVRSLTEAELLPALLDEIHRSATPPLR